MKNFNGRRGDILIRYMFDLNERGEEDERYFN